MRIPKIYLETTLFNYYFDKNRDAHADTKKLFDEIKHGKYEAYTSTYVFDELDRAPEPKRSKMLELIADFNVITLIPDAETLLLAQHYTNSGIIPERFRTDALHIAIASVKDLDLIVSMNFGHIVKRKTKVAVESINLSNGYRRIEILSPMEVVENDEK
ncbi:MAG: hypothetical protein FWH03_04370 [Firmicutes bacterium]|nr:hypothetical protein [Bacillota bacterium]